MNGTDSMTRRKLLTAIGLAGAAAAAGGLQAGLARALAAPTGVSEAVYGGGIGCSNCVIPTTIAAIRGKTDSGAGELYYVTDPGQEGHFRLDPADAASADNTGTVLVSAYGERFKRLYGREPVNAAWFGTKGDGIANDTSAIRQAIAAVSTGTVYVPPGSYLINDTIEVPPTLSFICEGALVYDGEGTAVKIGSDTAYTRNKTYKLSVDKKTINFAGSSVGVEFVNLYHNTIELGSVTRFSKNVLLSAKNGFGFYSNFVSLGMFQYGKVHVLIKNQNKGWANGNEFYGGSFTGGYDQAIGVKFETDYNGLNGNAFYSPKFEMGVGGTRFTVPVHMVNCSGNRFIAVRTEANNPNYFAYLKDCLDNHFDFTMALSSTKLYELGKSLRNAVNDNKTLLFDSGFIAQKCNYYNGDKVFVRNLDLLSLDGAFQRSSVVESGVSLVTFNGQSVNCATLRMILSLYVDTSLLKTFRFVKNTVPGTGTRLHFRCLDASGSLLTGESVPVTAGDGWEYNRYIVSSNEPYLYTYYGGTYTESNDSVLTDIRVHPDVKTIQLLVAMKQLISFQIYGIGSTGPELCRIWTNSNNDRAYAVAAPTLGEYRKGTILYDDNSTVGGYAGWVCVTAGSPGTWKRFGAIEA
ncbi:glycosyl hydrolase family 28-related protein [Paenibacillus ginsengarvi]|uniref:Rhamnogalacturonase A/B/Epimerase-like pectate lyase domain-containing protein n=1 Tax=Paenibacillus ginsengarvi TaxID=400777 RepID=A0A3B0CC33_9BACL|nr:glycosyl hydrolase family 28-related protein [Paenibacillus ginsengarvi]RKN80536.1 hypothetical protein D7M11_20565 [Paenibacillus ginsengarvi]